MKMYYFNPNGYSKSAYVMAESREKAIEYLLNDVNTVHDEYYKKVAKGMVDPEGGYTIEEYDVGKVRWDENC